MLPEKYYRVALDKGESKKLRFREKGGKTYAYEKLARKRLEELRRRGVRCSLYVTETDWKLVDSERNDIDGQEMLW